MIKDNLNNCALYFGANMNFEKAFNFIKTAIKEDLPVGKYEIDGTNVYALIQEYTSKLSGDAKNEGHRNYIDIQFVINGEEVIEVCDISLSKIKTDYNPEKDVEFYFDAEKPTTCILNKGEYTILFPQDVHKPCIALNENQAPVKKIVVKVKK
ncbi:MAG: YhcH/YjgK/YiaL family protein [Clostridia bacterium]|nr:YhcH/YjgK/YiaL family protein [Clostridia bacterium]